MFFLKNIFFGLLIGMANVIPGLSGATIALILGIYEKLINTISAIKKDTLLSVYNLNFKKIYQDLSLDFLIPISIGIISSALLFAYTLEYFDLLGKNKEYTLSYFFGLILCSVPIIINMIPNFRYTYLFYFIFGIIIAVSIAITPGIQQENNNIIFIFFCGVVGITGMVVPGLSGSYLLLILGNYNLLVKDSINKFHEDINSFIYLLVFTLGMVFGMISLAKIISWLFKKYRNQTLSIIAGFILGSLIFIWPVRSEEATAYLEVINPIINELNNSGNIMNYFNNYFHLIFFIVAGFLSLFSINFISRKKYV